MHETAGGTEAGGDRHHDVVDEMERESFPASDAPSTWAGREPGEGPASDADADIDLHVDAVADPIPEADDPAIARAWEDAEAMEGQAPTG